jgi:MFS family permease
MSGVGVVVSPSSGSSKTAATQATTTKAMSHASHSAAAAPEHHHVVSLRQRFSWWRAQLKRPDMRNLMIIHFNIFVYALGYWLTYPLLPFMLKELGATSLSLGAVQSLFNLVQLAGGLVVGYLQDHYSGSAALSVTQLGSAVVYLVLFTSNSLAMLYVSRLATVLQQSMQVAQAYISKLTTSEERAIALSRLSISYSVGMITGGMLSGVLVDRLGLRGTCLVAALCSVGVIIVNYFRLDPMALKSPTLGKEEPYANQTENASDSVRVPIDADEGNPLSPQKGSVTQQRRSSAHEQPAAAGSDSGSSVVIKELHTGKARPVPMKLGVALEGFDTGSDDNDGDHGAAGRKKASSTSSSSGIDPHGPHAATGSGMASYWSITKSLRHVVLFLALLFATKSLYEPVHMMVLMERFGVGQNAMGSYVSAFATIGLLSNILGTPAAMTLTGSESRSINFFISIGLAAHIALALASPQSAPLYLLLFGVITVCAAVLYTLSSSFITMQVPKEFHGRAIALSHAVRSATGILFPVLGATIYTYAGFEVALVANALLLLGARFALKMQLTR